MKKQKDRARGKRRVEAAMENDLRNTDLHISSQQPPRDRVTIAAQNPPTTLTHGGGGGGASSLPFLPDDVVFDILSRLPIKALKRFRRVCKSWYHTISSHRFASRRAAHTTTLLIRDLDEPCGLSLVEFQRRGGGGFVDIGDGLTDLNTQLTKEDHGFVGSCDGFLCLALSRHRRDGTNHRDEQLYVCNPVLGEYMALPTLPPPPLADEYARQRIGYGFGVNSATMEFKVIRLVFRWNDFFTTNRSFESEAQIFTIGVGGGSSWRNIGGAPYPLNTGESAALVNGSLHWLTSHFPGFIVCFNVALEEFGFVTHPPGYCHGKCGNSLLHLMELGGQLCLSDTGFLGEHLVIWVMKEYGVGVSWVKQYNVEQPKVLGFKRLHYWNWILCRPLVLMDNGEILCLGIGNKFFRFDPVTKTLHLLEIPGLPTYLSAITCTGSLVSLRSVAGDN